MKMTMMVMMMMMTMMNCRGLYSYKLVKGQGNHYEDNDYADNGDVDDLAVTVTIFS